MNATPRSRTARRGAGAAVGVLVLLALLVPAFAALTFPPLTGRVVDTANLLSAEDERALIIDLEALEEKTTDQLVVVTVPSLQGTDIADYGFQLGRAWAIGQAGKDNGALLIVAPNERKVRIEVGYGLEGALTDALTKVIIDNAILPHFRQGDFAGGIKAGVRDVVEVLTGDPSAVRERLTSRPEAQNDELIGLIVMLIWFGIFGFVLWNLWQTARPGGSRGRGWAPIGGWSGGRGGWSGGGGFSGGGGSFGGGGSSGGW